MNNIDLGKADNTEIDIDANQAKFFLDEITAKRWLTDVHCQTVQNYKCSVTYQKNGRNYELIGCFPTSIENIPFFDEPEVTVSFDLQVEKSSALVNGPKFTESIGV